MLTPYKIENYFKEFNPTWAVKMPEGCPPEDVLVPSEHLFYRLAKKAGTYNEEDLNRIQRLTLPRIGENNYR